jgi:hypothetical protein
VRRAAACCAAANSAAYSALPALTTTHGMIAEKARMMPLIFAGWSTSPKKKSPQATDREWDLERYDASTSECKTMSHMVKVVALFMLVEQ